MAKVSFPNYFTVPQIAERVARVFFGFADVADKLDGGVLADLGCGIGTVLAAIERRHQKAVTIGVDKNPEYLEEARKMVSGRLIRAELHEIPLADSSVDLAFGRRLYVPFNEDCSGIAMEIQRVLRHGGVYIADEAAGYRAHEDALAGLGMEILRCTP